MKAPLQIKIKLGLLAGDLILFSLCPLTASYIRRAEIAPLFGQYSTAWILCLMIYPLSLYLTRSYEVQPEASPAENLRRPLGGLLFAATATSFLFFFARS